LMFSTFSQVLLFSTLYPRYSFLHFFHTILFTVSPHFSDVIIFHIFSTLFSHYSFPHFFHPFPMLPIPA
jgi:hypothetical protein